MVDYRKFDAIKTDSSDDSDSASPGRRSGPTSPAASPKSSAHLSGERGDFIYPCGVDNPHLAKFNTKDEVCKPFGFLHGDVAVTEEGLVSTAIGVREGSLMFHAEHKQGAGQWPAGTKLTRVGNVRVQGGQCKTRAPSLENESDWLQLTFPFPSGVLITKVEKFDTRDDICMSVGNFKHGQLVKVPGMNRPCVTVGVRRDELGRVLLWFYKKGAPGAGIFDRDDMEKSKVVGTEVLEPKTSLPGKQGLLGLGNLSLSSSDSEAEASEPEGKGEQRTFSYPIGTDGLTRKVHFDVRDEVCLAHGFSHGDVVITESGIISTAIGVRKGWMFFHKEESPGAGRWEDTSLTVVGRTRVQEHGAAKAPSDLDEWLELDFPYPAGPRKTSTELFDVRDEICKKVGGFRHGEVVQVPGMPITSVTVGVKRAGRGTGRLLLWFHMKGASGAGIFDKEQLAKSKVVGTQVLQPTTSLPTKQQARSWPFGLGRLFSSDSEAEASEPEGKGEGKGEQRTFMYPMGARHMAREVPFDVREEACRPFGFSHGDVVVTDCGIVSTAIGVREGSMWFHKEDSPGAGQWPDVKLTVVGLTRVEEHGAAEAPSVSNDWLRLDFPYPAGLQKASTEMFDIRDDICKKVGGFRHGEVVRVPGMSKTSVTIGVKRAVDGRVLLWFHHKDTPGAGVHEKKHLKKAKVAGTEVVHAAGAPRMAATPGGGSGDCPVCRRLRQALDEEQSARRAAERRADALQTRLDLLDKEKESGPGGAGQKKGKKKEHPDSELANLRKKNEKLRQSNSELLKSSQQSAKRVKEKEIRLQNEKDKEVARLEKEQQRQVASLKNDYLQEKKKLESELQQLREKEAQRLDNCIAQPASSGELWQYMDNSKKWVSYSPTVSQQIMEAYQKGASSCNIECEGKSYQVDFLMMQQMNLRTEMRRTVRCSFQLPAHWGMSDQDALKVVRGGRKDEDQADDAVSEMSAVSAVTGRSLSTTCQAMAPFRRHARKITDPDTCKRFEQLLQASLRRSDGSLCPEGCIHSRATFHVVEVYQVENLYLWRRYQRCRQTILDKQVQFGITPQAIDPPVGPALTDFGRTLQVLEQQNERLLFHGTRTMGHAKIIAVEGFDSRVAQAGLYGQGTYFASQSCKSAQYATRRGNDQRATHRQLGTVILSRVALGDPFYTQTNYSGLRPPQKTVFDNSEDEDDERVIPADSVIAVPGISRNFGSQLHMEFVIFAPEQAYPEYIIRFHEHGD